MSVENTGDMSANAYKDLLEAHGCAVVDNLKCARRVAEGVVGIASNAQALLFERCAESLPSIPKVDSFNKHACNVLDEGLEIVNALGKPNNGNGVS